MKHLYIHIPFCHRRCSYCDFNSYANMDDRIEPYVAALCAELAMLASITPTPPVSAEAAALRPTIFLGGGTPTMLTLDQIERVLVAASQIVPLAGAEISCEANPGTLLDPDYLRGLRQLGVNRLSLGVQSLHNPTLRILGRIHSAEEAHQSYLQAREAGFESISLDFIFGLPGQTLEDWETTLNEISTWQPDHLSLYSLILEEQTPLYAQVTAGRIRLPDDDRSATMYEMAIEHLAANGYVQYEISNFARSHTAGPLPSHACQHNLAYWLNSDYLAAGAGAYGHLTLPPDPHRYANRLTIEGYMAALDAGQRPLAEIIPLSPADICAETMMMGLRLNIGVGAAHFAARCGHPLDAIYSSEIADLLAQGLLQRDTERVWLTPRGRMIGNQVFQRFL
ncbi:putative oxygen-independent coproporphyrinogen III oxidase [Oscillochloris trichoides DG-6]|uniref:Heme chaperone HemW n=1 Tax=Oscillochloris trichoides DG-6 TaxID=765420 RepID=E1IH67_9CHLR|nr:radical SAM family heme chaperone HemW [Oscillochloris trichoides]EFO79542.1 putative oxygen-independent coproporphyrinogen III oxidase [Oscillochloris trichoides DG-6]